MNENLPNPPKPSPLPDLGNRDGTVSDARQSPFPSRRALHRQPATDNDVQVVVTGMTEIVTPQARVEEETLAKSSFLPAKGSTEVVVDSPESFSPVLSQPALPPVIPESTASTNDQDLSHSRVRETGDQSAQVASILIRVPALTLVVGVLVAFLAVLLGWIATPANTIENDVYYYWEAVTRASSEGFGEVLVEYPLPAALLLWIPTLFTSTYPAYFTVLWVFMGLLVIAMAALLTWGLKSREAGISAAFIWLASIAALGPLSFFRFDLLPGVLLAVAVVLIARGGYGWASITGIAIGLKLWPIVMLPFGFAERKRRLVEGIGLLSTAVVLVGLSLVVAGWDRLISPLTWQGERGLHLESVLALPLVIGKAISQDTWEVTFSSNNSWDLAGPTVGGFLIAGTVIQVLLAIWIFWLVVRCWRTRALSAGVLSVAVAGTLMACLAANKVFSPQYLLWVLPILAVSFGLLSREKKEIPRWWLPATVVMALLTQLVYPTFYTMYLWNTGVSVWVGALGLVTRNLVVIALAFSLSRYAYRHLHPSVTVKVQEAPSFVEPPSTSDEALGGQPTSVVDEEAHDVRLTTAEVAPARETDDHPLDFSTIISGEDGESAVRSSSRPTRRQKHFRKRNRD